MSQRLGDLLVREKVITADQLEKALREQGTSGTRLGAALVKLGFLSDDDELICPGHMSGDDARTSREKSSCGNSMILFTLSTPSYIAT